MEFKSKIEGWCSVNWWCQTVLSKEDEQVIAKLVDDVAEWGFPVGRFEIKLMVKDLLDSINVVYPKKYNNE